MQIPRESGEAEIKKLLGLSARLGRDPLMVQASSGNTSIKLGDTLWIKASGKWLARALDEVTLVPLCLSQLRKCLQKAGNVAEVLPCANGIQLQASIETAMHAVLPHRVVIHVHSVNAIAWAVRHDGPERLAQRLSGLPWAWIPYVASGIPLARFIEREIAVDQTVSIFVLANHGLVVCGATCEEAELLLAQVERRLAGNLRACSSGHDLVSRRILGGGVLFPCQVIFLGRGDDWLSYYDQPEPVHREHVQSFTAAQKIVMSALMQVALRIEESAPIRYLSESQVQDLLTEDVHNYRLTSEQNAVLGS